MDQIFVTTLALSVSFFCRIVKHVKFQRILFCPSPSVYGVFYAVFCTFVSVKPPTNKLFRFLFFLFLFRRISDSKTPTFWCSSNNSRRNPFGMEIWCLVRGPFLCWAVSCLGYSFWCFADESEWVSIPPWSSCSPDNLELRNIGRGYAQIVRVFWKRMQIL